MNNHPDDQETLLRERHLTINGNNNVHHQEALNLHTHDPWKKIRQNLGRTNDQHKMLRTINKKNQWPIQMMIPWVKKL